ncbi:oxidoreductase [Kribbella turkmenica]|uniref:Oxidoreductase n=1 Tax=Kribbella turkmenica TaxID=2530375 RepID=A0A4V6PD99_9ACTN|nr:oxidoreductase [Kribbella turkmenica]TDD26907.1 oxidoreductase [Kribbella turkmenica]
MPPRIGLVELDTSHPAAFVPLLRELGLEVSAVLDSGAVRPPGYAAEFAERHGIAVVANELDELPVDAALLLGCDWDQRYEQACTLLDAGLAVVLDKPIAGRAGDLRDLAARAEAGQSVGGGSSFRCLPDALAWRARGEVAALVLVGCAGHPFYYGVHAVSFAEALLGPGFIAARALDESSRRGLLRHASGAEVLVDVQEGYPYFATVATSTSVEHLRPDPGQLYRPFLTAHLVGVAPKLSVEPELMLLALARSAATGGDWVDPASLPDSFSPWDAAAYTAAYTPPA